MARVLFLDAYHGPSHRALSVALRDRSRHQVTLFSLPPRKWKWRMRGAAFAFELLVRALPAPPEILVVTDMLSLPELLGLLRDALPARLPVVTYFHENQITYPLPSKDVRDFHFGLANIHTALCSDLVVFNSAFHRDQFLDALPALFDAMPDHRPAGIPERIRSRCQVLGPPLDLPDELVRAGGPRGRLVLWNHRWEEDKDPGSFFRVMRVLDRRGVDFQMLVLGQSFRERPACFVEAERDLPHRIAAWGHLPSRREYLEAVSRCRVVVSTARHEFFGLAVREAIALGCRPLLPRRVVYPELVGGRDEHLYDTEQELAERLESVLEGDFSPAADELRGEIASQTVERVVARWDAWFDEMAPPPA